MSIVISTDVFCDGVLDNGERCLEWEHGCTGSGSNDITYARKLVAHKGWRVRKRAGRLIDLCPRCAGTAASAIHAAPEDLPGFTLRSLDAIRAEHEAKPA